MLSKSLFYYLFKILLPFLCLFPLLLEDFLFFRIYKSLTFSFMIPCLSIFDFVLCDSSFTFSSRSLFWVSAVIILSFNSSTELYSWGITFCSSRKPLFRLHLNLCVSAFFKN